MSKSKNISIVNRKAKFEYSFLSSFEAGLVLKGTEVKSLRNGNANLNDAYCLFKSDGLYILSMYIGEYEYGNNFNHEPRRTRKLLLKKTELKKLRKRVDAKGFSIVPYRIYFSERGFAKMEIALAQGKKSFDKRNTIKEKDAKRELQRQEKYQ